MKILLLADFESVAGAVHPSQVVPGSPEYEAFRRIWMQELNAAIDGAIEGGAEQILVAEAHMNNRNVIPDLAHERAAYVSGLIRRDMQLTGLDSSFGGVFMFTHARAGTASGVLAHSFTFTGVRNITFNGRDVGEIGLNTALAAERRVPVRLVVGDRAAVEEATDLIPGVESVVTKVGLAPNVARWEAPAVIQRRIAEAAARAVQAPPPSLLELEPPFEVAIELATPTLATLCAFMPAVEAVDETVVRCVAATVDDAYHFVHVCVFLVDAAMKAERPPDES